MKTKQMYPVWVAMVTLVLVGLGGNLSGRAQELKYLPDSACLAIQLRPHAALAEPALATVPREMLEVFGRKELGLDLLKLERLLIVVGKVESFSSPEPPGLAIFAEFSEPQTLGGRMTSELPAGEDAGQKVWQLDPQTELRQISPQIFALGMPDFVAEALQGGTQPGAVGKAIVAAAANEHLTLAIDLKMLRPALEEALPPEDQVPPPFRGFLDIPELVENLTLRHSWSSGGASKLRIAAGSEDDANRLERLMRAAINNIQQLALPVLMNELPLEEDYQLAMQAFMERVSEEFKQGVAASRVGNAFEIDLQTNQQVMSVSIIGTMTALLLPAVQSARSAAQRTVATNNLRQIMLAMLNYESAYGHFPSQAITGQDGQKLLSWRVAILPYLEQEQLYRQFHLDEPWDSEHNLKLLDQMPDVYRVPEVDLGGETLYLAITGKGTAFEAGRKLRMAEVFDGMSNTIGIVEVNPAVAVPWTKPEDLNFEPGEELIGLGGVRPGGFLAAFLDGSTRFISESVDRETLRRLFLIRDGEPVGDLDRDR